MGAAVLITGHGNADITRYNTLMTAIKQGQYCDLGTEGDRWGRPSFLPTCKASEIAKELRIDFTLANHHSMLYIKHFEVEFNNAISTHASMTITMSNKSEVPNTNTQAKPVSLARRLETYIAELCVTVDNEQFNRK